MRPITAEPPKPESPFDPPFSVDEAEIHYRVLGAWKGPMADARVQGAADAFGAAPGSGEFAG
jgi:hypothetical protein